MNERNAALLRQIQEIGFVCIELQLFLDTHPNDSSAREQFTTYSRQLRELKRHYDREVGPLHGFGYSTIEGGSWVFATPWPWECQ